MPLAVVAKRELRLEKVSASFGFSWTEGSLTKTCTKRLFSYQPMPNLAFNTGYAKMKLVHSQLRKLQSVPFERSNVPDAELTFWTFRAGNHQFSSRHHRPASMSQDRPVIDNRSWPSVNKFQ